MIVKLGGRGSCRAAVPKKHTARQEPRPPEIRLHLEFAEIHDCTIPVFSPATSGNSVVVRLPSCGLLIE